MRHINVIMTCKGNNDLLNDLVKFCYRSHYHNMVLLLLLDLFNGLFSLTTWASWYQKGFK